MEFALKIIIACWYKLLDNFYGSFHDYNFLGFLIDWIAKIVFLGK